MVLKLTSGLDFSNMTPTHVKIIGAASYYHAHGSSAQSWFPTIQLNDQLVNCLRITNWSLPSQSDERLGLVFTLPRVKRWWLGAVFCESTSNLAGQRKRPFGGHEYPVGLIIKWAHKRSSAGHSRPQVLAGKLGCQDSLRRWWQWLKEEWAGALGEVGVKPASLSF